MTTALILEHALCARNVEFAVLQLCNNFLSSTCASKEAYLEARVTQLGNQEARI